MVNWFEVIAISTKDKSGVAETCLGHWKAGRCEAASVLDNGALRHRCTEVRLALAERGNELTKYDSARKTDTVQVFASLKSHRVTSW